MEWRELDTVPVYFAEIQVFADRDDVCGGDVVCSAPDVGGCVVLALVSRLSTKFGSRC
jgi:hypothetical protein